MVDAKWVGSPNFYSQNGVQKLFITDHWAVGTLRSTDVAFNGSRKASATYCVGQSEVHQYVLEKDYPFSDGNTYANQHTISIEHEGGWIGADGNRVTPSEAVCELSAQLHADIARRHNFGRLQLGVNVFPHKHWVATECPGTLGINWIVDRANALLGEPAAAGVVDLGTAVALGLNRSGHSDLWVQQRLTAWGYPVAQDNIYGPDTTAKIRMLQHDHGLVVDGITGPNTTALLASDPVFVAPSPGLVLPPHPTFPLPKGYYFGPEGGPARSVSGYHSHNTDLMIWQHQMQKRGWGILVDGLYGYRGDKTPRGNTASVAYAFQKEKGLTVDGLIGPQTWNAAWTEPIT
jgi:peptidoglycan hydrolase-like protein with peptidoglycan-binding domain